MADSQSAPAQTERDRRAESLRVVRRRRLSAAGALLAVLAAIIALVLDATAGTGHRRHAVTPASSAAKHKRPAPRPSAFAVGLRRLQLTDNSRAIKLPEGTSEPRTLQTEVRYPALGAASRLDVAEAPAASSYGPFPLIVFGHGFNEKPSLYHRLLEAWAHAGYVVAAPEFPLEKPEAPGGPNEEDLVNQPADMSFVITRLLEASREPAGPLTGMIDPRRIVLAGQSDGGDTALAAAYDPRHRDRRVDAAIVLSGAEIPAEGSFTFPSGGPPLLATQGSADTINPPSDTQTYFEAAHRPKYLLTLPGAEHLGPYTSQQPQLSIVERVSLAFLAGYLGANKAALAELTTLGNVSGVAELRAEG